MLKKLSTKPGEDQFRPTRLWKDNGGSIETLARILGHASVKTTWDLYGTQSLQDVCRNYQKTIVRF